MKKYVKLIGQLLIWSLFGFFGMIVALEMEVSFDFVPYTYPGNVLLLVVAAAFAIFSVYCYFGIRKTTKQDLSGEEEDIAEGSMYRQYTDASLGSTLAMLFSLAALSLALLTAQPIWMLIVGIALTVFSSIMSMVLPGLMPRMYPDRNLPSISDKHYATKLLESSDDGEKHIMLGGLYKTYLTMNSLLFVAILLLLFYSILSGTSQLFSIFLIIAVLAFANAQYMFSIRNK